jgi:hypothetical protein
MLERKGYTIEAALQMGPATPLEDRRGAVRGWTGDINLWSFGQHGQEQLEWAAGSQVPTAHGPTPVGPAPRIGRYRERIQLPWKLPWCPNADDKIPGCQKH